MRYGSVLISPMAQTLLYAGIGIVMVTFLVLDVRHEERLQTEQNHAAIQQNREEIQQNRKMLIEISGRLDSLAQRERSRR